MFDLEFAIRALALAALALFLTPASALGLSARTGRFVRLAAIGLLALAMAAALRSLGPRSMARPSRWSPSASALR
jgi:hypothetical protein